MKTTNRNKGPFPLHITQNDEHFVIVTNQGNHYAKTFDPSAARLIASAPDLLSALIALEKASREVLDTSATHDGLENCKTLLEARIAIQKARGEA